MPEAVPEAPKQQWCRMYLLPDRLGESNTLYVESYQANLVLSLIAAGRPLSFTTRDGKVWAFAAGYIKVANITPLNHV